MTSVPIFIAGVMFIGAGFVFLPFDSVGAGAVPTESYHYITLEFCNIEYTNHAMHAMGCCVQVERTGLLPGFVPMD